MFKPRMKGEGVQLFIDPRIKKAERKVYEVAMWEYLFADKINIDKYLQKAGEGRFYDHKRDNKGKLVSCKFGIFYPITKYELL